MQDHPDEEVQRAAADPNAGGLSPRDLAIEAAKRLKQVLDGNDQREACERVYGSYERSDELGPIDCRTVVDYLTGLLQPDPGPIDAEWLESIGESVIINDEHAFGVSIPGMSATVVVEQGTSDAIMHVTIERQRFHLTPRNRQHLLDLIAALKGGAE